jgi:hypothetical protein
MVYYAECVADGQICMVECMVATGIAFKSLFLLFALDMMSSFLFI